MRIVQGHVQRDVAIIRCTCRHGWTDTLVERTSQKHHHHNHHHHPSSPCSPSLSSLLSPPPPHNTHASPSLRGVDCRVHLANPAGQPGLLNPQSLHNKKRKSKKEKCKCDRRGNQGKNTKTGNTSRDNTMIGIDRMMFQVTDPMIPKVRRGGSEIKNA